MPDLKQRIVAGEETLLGTFHDFVDPLFIELMAYSGFDFVILDHEQTMSDFQNLLACIRGAESSGISTFVRLAEPVGYTVERALSAGADGLILSRAGSREQVQEFVDRTLFAPAGKRGSTYMRGDLWNPAKNGRQRQLEANEKVVTFAIIEDREGLKNVEEIAKVEGLTGMIPGHGDLTLDLGAESWESPEVLEAMDHIMEVARRNGKFVMIPCIAPERVAPALAKGANLLMMNHDTIIVGETYSALRTSMQQAVAAAKSSAKTPSA